MAKVFLVSFDYHSGTSIFPFVKKHLAEIFVTEVRRYFLHNKPDEEPNITLYKTSAFEAIQQVVDACNDTSAAPQKIKYLYDDINSPLT